MRPLYAEWLNVDGEFLGRLDGYNTEGFVVFPHGWAEVRKFSWSSPSELVWGTGRRCYLLDMPLNRAASGATAQYITASADAGVEPLGHLSLVPPGQTVRTWSSGAGQCRSIRCALDAGLVEALLPGEPRWSADPELLRNTFSIRSGRMEWLLHSLSRELQHPGFGSVAMAEAIAGQLAVELVRKFELDRADSRGRCGGLAPWRLRLIRERVERDGASPTLGELAELCNLTVRHLTRAFREETGETIGDFVAGVMVERASRMLRDGARVADVATALGYTSAGSFSTAFRKATGLSPRAVKESAGRH
jgi:AraC family transcriptional regulator